MIFDFKNIAEKFNQIKSDGFSEEIVNYSTIKNKLENLTRDFPFAYIEKISASENGIPIYLIKIGNGKIKVLSWSQMHGNEPTATKSFFDFIEFLKNPLFEEEKNFLLNNLTIYIIPLLNPDGSEKWTRENFFGIDINRDAKKLVSAEANFLQSCFEDILPDYCLNLHDQDGWYSVGNSAKPTLISFLSPPFDAENQINSTRKKAISVISKSVEILEQFYPNRIARYSDEFEPRAFGDNFTAKGSSVILIEAGRWDKHRNFEVVRKAYFLSLLSILNNIIKQNKTTFNISKYRHLPFNRLRFFDLILKNIEISKQKLVDIVIKRVPFFKHNKIRYYGKIEFIGDASNYDAFEEYDLLGYRAEKGKKQVVTEKEIPHCSTKCLIYGKKGITNLKTKTKQSEEIGLNLERIDCDIPTDILVGNFANFSLINTNNEVEFLILNGNFINLNIFDFPIDKSINFTLTSL